MSQNGDWLIKVSKKVRKYVKLSGASLLIAATIFSYFYINRSALDVPSQVRVLAAKKDNCNLDQSYKNIKDHVVRIENKTDDELFIGNGFFEKDGYLVTNSHIVDKKGVIKVIFPDDKTVEAKLVANNQYMDLAILAVDKEQVTSLPWGDTAKLDINDDLVFAGKNNEGNKSNIAILSARKLYNEIAFLQTDIGINKNESGAPLINVCGEVVGVSLFSKDSKVNLSIDANSAQKTIMSLITSRIVEYVESKATTQTVLSDTQILKEINKEGTDVQITKGDDKTKENTSGNSAEDHAAPSCSTIQADKFSLDLDDETLLSFSYKGADGDITWSGQGKFSEDQDPSAKSSIIKWSNKVSGKYDLSAVVKNKFGECKQMITLSVNQPHISGILSATGEALMKSSDGKYYAEVKNPISITASGTTTKNYSIIATSPTGYGGSVSGTVTSQMTFVPPVIGNYTFTLTGNSGTKGASIEIIVQNVVGSLTISGSALLTDSAGNNYAKVNNALIITASNTINKNYNIVASSSTGYGGSVSGTVTSQMTFVPPVIGNYTFTLTGSNGLAGYTTTIKVQNIVGTLTLSGASLTKDANGNYYSKVGVPIIETVTNTLDKKYLMVMTSKTGWGGSLNGIVQNYSTTIPPVADTYTYFIAGYEWWDACKDVAWGKCSAPIGDSITVTVIK